MTNSPSSFGPSRSLARDPSSFSDYHVVVVGKTGGTNVGASLYRAAEQRGYEASIVDMGRAYDGPWWQRAFCWHVLGHRPPRLNTFSRNLVDHVREVQPDVLLTTGLAPITGVALAAVKNAGIRCVNFSTDDPWNPNHRARRFFEALPHYDVVFTPRHANEDQFRRAGCRTEYLPFGYDPELFYPVGLSDEERRRLQTDALFVGGADDERVELLTPLIESDVELTLYGDYWEDYDETAPYTRGHGSPGTLRKATRAARVNLCLVRRANRDGHVMRSLEIPAIGACMVVEDTAEHRALFGSPDEAVRYFDSSTDLVDTVRDLLDCPEERTRLAQSVHKEIVEIGHHTYADRLDTMIAATLGADQARRAA